MLFCQCVPATCVVFGHSYHSGVPQVQSVPAESLWEAVGLLANVVLVWFDGAVWCHSLPWRRRKTLLTLSTNHSPRWDRLFVREISSIKAEVKEWRAPCLAWEQAACPRIGNSSESPPPWFWQDLGLQRTAQWPFGSPVAYQLAMNWPVSKVKKKLTIRRLNNKFNFDLRGSRILDSRWFLHSFPVQHLNYVYYIIPALATGSWGDSVAPAFFFFLCFLFFFLAPVSSPRPLSLKTGQTKTAIPIILLSGRKPISCQNVHFSILIQTDVLRYTMHCRLVRATYQLENHFSAAAVWTGFCLTRLCQVVRWKRNQPNPQSLNNVADTNQVESKKRMSCPVCWIRWYGRKQGDIWKQKGPCLCAVNPSPLSYHHNLKEPPAATQLSNFLSL